jgi:hypothetical protein
MKLKSLMKFSLLMMSAILLFTSCAPSCESPKPIPRDKESFVGHWYSRSGFQVEINADGRARVIQIENSKDPDCIKLNISITAEYCRELLVKFSNDSVLYIKSNEVRTAKKYVIIKEPFLDGDTTKMILNGVMLIKQERIAGKK